MTVYVDELFLRLAGDFLLDWSLLWATAQVTRARTTRLRLAAGAFCGIIYEVLYLLARWRLIGGYGLLNFWVTKLAFALPMVALAFAPVPGRRFFTLTGYFFGLNVITVGAAYFAGNLTQSRWVMYIVAFTTLFVVAELGWGVVHRLLWQELLHIPMAVTLGGRRVELVAMLDTANHLRDPLTGEPVIIVELEALRPLLPPELLEALREGEGSNLPSLTTRLNGDLALRFRVLPYSSIGREHGLLVGFRPDAVSLRQQGRELQVEDVIVAVYQRRFRPAGEYRALVHPELLEGALASNG